MGKIVAFPNSRFVTDSTVGLEVIAAPLGNDLIAWIRTERGFVILERADDWGHVLRDGRAYAARHGIPFRTQRERLADAFTDRARLRAAAPGEQVPTS